MTPEPAEEEYVVEWSMPLTGDSPVDVARQALGVHRDPESIATVFFVTKGDDAWIVDLHSDGSVNEVKDLGESDDDN